MDDTADEPSTVIKRRISWEQFYKMHPHRRPANDNKHGKPTQQSESTAPAGAK